MTDVIGVALLIVAEAQIAANIPTLGMTHVTRIVIIIGKDLGREKSPMIEIIFEVIDRNLGTGKVTQEEIMIKKNIG